MAGMHTLVLLYFYFSFNFGFILVLELTCSVSTLALNYIISHFFFNFEIDFKLPKLALNSLHRDRI